MNNMKINREGTSIKELTDGYINNDSNNEGGVYSMNGKLNIRPKFQRSYIHASNSVKERRWKTRLIESIINKRPIGLFYVGKNTDGSFEQIDGQQRLITICEFVHNNFSIKYNGSERNFVNLPNDIQNNILNYCVDLYVCEGTESERLEWFRTINEPNACLTEQELRNSVYPGEWLESAKRYFSAPNSRVVREISDKNSLYCFKYFANGKHIDRQDYLETVLDWISYYEFHDEYPKINTSERIEKYMCMHQHDKDASELINFYKKVIDWIRSIFLVDESRIPHSMSSAKWGQLYTKYHKNEYNGEYCTKRVKFYLENDSVTMQNRIYEFILMGEHFYNENILQPRSLSNKDKETLYERQGRMSPIDKKHYTIDELEVHHILPFCRGGKTNLENCILITKEQHQTLIHMGNKYNDKEIKEMSDKHNKIQTKISA